jgi:retinol dehydrogenase 14
MAPDPSSPLADRVAVVTGATSGIGRELAERLAGLGADVVLVGRGEDRVAAAADAIARATGNPRIEPVPVTDLAALSEMRSVAERVSALHPRIHVLVNNAGGFFVRREPTADGLERTFALNVLAPYVLTNLLAGPLRAGVPSRVVQVASAAHRAHHVPLDDLQASHRYRGFQQYGRSKLELILLTREFGRRFAGSGVIVNAVHPGFVRSGFGLNNGGGTAFGMRLAALLFGRSLRHGAEPPLYVAADPSVTTSGAYYSGAEIARGSAASNDPEVAARLWDECSRLSGVAGIPSGAGA